MRIDIGIWAKRKLLHLHPKFVSEADEGAYESHWLRFEKYMGARDYLGTSTENRRFLLTDVDFIMGGNKFY
jgi:hypothetical protein